MARSARARVLRRARGRHASCLSCYVMPPEDAIRASAGARGVVIVKRLNEQLVGHVGDVVDRECTSRPLNIFSSKDSY